VCVRGGESGSEGPEGEGKVFGDMVTSHREGSERDRSTGTFDELDCRRVEVLGARGFRGYGLLCRVGPIRGCPQKSSFLPPCGRPGGARRRWHPPHVEKQLQSGCAHFPAVGYRLSWVYEKEGQNSERPHNFFPSIISAFACRSRCWILALAAAKGDSPELS